MIRELHGDFLPRRLLERVLAERAVLLPDRLSSERCRRQYLLASCCLRRPASPPASAGTYPCLSVVAASPDQQQGGGDDWYEPRSSKCSHSFSSHIG